MNKPYYISLALLVVVLSACHNSDTEYDASGSFEAVETIISSEVNGKIMEFDLSEGQEVKAGQIVGYIDSTQLHLQKLQLLQNKKAILSGRPQTQVQIKALEEQLTTAKSNRERTANLVKGGVANQKQLDDANAQVATLEAQLSAQKSTLNTATASIDEQGSVVDIQLQDVTDKLNKCKITNPVNGIVLSKYVEPFEMTAAGRPLYKVADLSTLILRVYITGDQLPQVQLNQDVTVMTDDGQGAFKETKGTIGWISDKAEFTPKSIQTAKERANKVYALKIRVANDGYLKIGMYGEVKF